MMMSTVCLRMTDGREVWFRAPQREVSRLVIMRHGREGSAGDGKEHLIFTEKEVPITVDLSLVRDILIT